MITPYYYTKVVVGERLGDEIAASSITIALENIIVDGADNLTINFKSALSTEEVTTLNGIVDAHVPTPIDLPPQEVTLSGPAEVTPLTPKNDQQLLPHGKKKLKFNSKEYVGSITITNDSGLVFSYTGESFDPAEGYYIVNDDSTIESEIEEVDLVNNKITLSDGEDCGCDPGTEVPNGTYKIIRPYVKYVKCPNVPGNAFLRELQPGFSLPAVCFYGYTATRITNAAENDFIELGVECKDGVPIDEETWAIPPGGWSVDYDYSWVDTLLVEPTVTVHLVDGSPGYIPSGFYYRIKYFHTEVSAVDKWVSMKLDIIFTKKDP